MLSHEVQRPLGPSLDGLPALHRQVLGPGHQGNLLKLVTPVGHGRWNVVVSAVVGERTLVEGLHHDLHLFLEHLPVGVLVQQGRAEGLNLAGVIPASHAEDHPSVGEDVGGGEVLGQPQGVPHWGDVEGASDLDALGQVGQVYAHHQQVGDALIALGLEVVFGHPEGVVAQPVHEQGNGFGLVEHGGQVFIGEGAVVDGNTRIADVVHVHVAGKKTVELVNHGLSSRIKVQGR